MKLSVAAACLQYVGKHEPCRTCDARRRFRLQEALDAAAEIRKSALFFDHIARRQHYGHLRGDRLWQCGPDVHDGGGARENCGIDSSEVIPDHQKRISLIQDG